MKKTIILALFLLLIPSLAVAQVEELIITTNISYADFAVASVVSSKIGAPLFFVSKESIPTEVLNEIQAINPEMIYIIGGPAVVSEELENELSLTYNLTRIWGMTRYGTSAEVAKYFWSEGSEEAVLVWDLPDSPEVNLTVSLMVTKAAEEAQDEEIPLLLIPKNHLPYEIIEALKTLNVSEVEVFGNVGSKVFEELTALGISYEWEAGEPEEIEEKIEMEIEEKVRKEKRPLVVAAVANWQEGVAVRATPKGVSILVFSEAEIPKVVEKVDSLVATGNVTRVLVVGKPELAEKIYDALINATINETVPVIFVTGKHYEILPRIFRRLKRRFERRREMYERKIEEIVETLAKLREKIEKKCDYWLVKANETLTQINTTLASARLNLVKELHNACLNALTENKPLIALRYLNEIKHNLMFAKWRERMRTPRVWEIFEEEMEKEEERAEKFRERVKGKWRVIKEIWERRREEMGELVEECREMAKELEEAIEEGNVEKAQELKIKITEKCRKLEIAEKVRRRKKPSIPEIPEIPRTPGIQ